ncbi:MAG: hypothetical protein Q7T71_18755, partial [Herbiconiux sp.]|nr:hypothetical protein [Herbiconiux sp.]
GDVPCPRLTAVQHNHAEALDDPAVFDEELLLSILHEATYEELYYQAMLRLVLQDATRHREILEWISSVLIERFGLAGRPGLELLSGVRTLDLAAGSIWRSSLVGKTVSGFFAVHPRALTVLVEGGDVPNWGFDREATVVHGRFVSPRAWALNAQSRRMWLSTLDLMLTQGFGRLLWEGEVKLLSGASRKEGVAS